MTNLSKVITVCSIVAVFAATYVVVSYVMELGQPELVQSGTSVVRVATTSPATATSLDIAAIANPTATATVTARSTATAHSTVTVRSTPTARSTATGRSTVQPSATPTESPVMTRSTAQPSPTRVQQTIIAPLVRPTTTPTPTPTPAQTPTPTVTALESTVERVIDAEATLKSGQIDASVVYTDDSRSTTSIRFDLGNDDNPPRAAIRTTYHSSGQTRTTEQIIIGSDVWERVDDGEWRAAGNVEAVWGQVQAYLPRMATVSASQFARDSRPDELRWYDPARDTDVTLRVDPDRGEPRAMLRVTRGTGTALDVVYTGWNSSVQIAPPVD